MPAQNLAQLKVDTTRVKTGTLANGMSYHIVPSSSTKGMADFVLVQKGTSDPDKARHNLTHLKAFGNVSPYSFLARNGVGPDKGGYIRYEGDATIYNFANVPVTSSSVVDSTFLMLFGIADTYSADQDVIIAGDVVAKDMQDKLRILSLMVPKREKIQAQDPYQWEPTSEPRHIFIHQPSGDDASISAIYASPRTPKENMNTAVPLVAMKYSYELGTILKARLARQMHQEGIPTSGIDFVRRSSADSPNDELYGITIYTDTTNIEKTAALLASTLAYLDERGASAEEYEDAKNDLFSNASNLAFASQDGNAALARRCVSAYLYGSDLATEKTISSFFTTKDLDPIRELGLFNDFVSALLDKSANLTLRCVSSTVADTVSIKTAFQKGWDEYRRSGSLISFRVNSADTLGFDVSPAKVKLKTTAVEPISSGEIWTFSNGMKVIYKRSTHLQGRFSYSLMVRGSYTSIEGLSVADSANIAQMLPLYDVAGLHGYDFRRMIEANGIKMSQAVTPSGLSVDGTAPSDKLMLLLKSLLGLCNSRTLNPEAYEYYRKNMSLTGDVSNLDDGFQNRAEKYFSRMFENFADGYLVLIGDLDPANLKKLLPKYVGGFEQGVTSVNRNQARETISSGTVTQIKDLMSLPDGSVMGVQISMNAPVTFTTERLMALQIASLALRKAMIKEIVPLGMYVETENSFRITPREQFSLTVTCRPSAYDGLPEGITPADPLDVLSAARKALSSAATKALSQAELSAYKTLLTNEIESLSQNPAYVTDMVRTRYLDGKDIFTGYKAKIRSVTAEMVREVISSLDSGNKVEEVIR